MNKLQDELLRMMKDLHIVLDQNKINYSLSCGSLLGAIRHDGFIPWDDDMDIEISIRDKERAIQILKTSLPKNYKWIDENSTKKWPYSFGKIVDTNIPVIDDFNNTNGNSRFLWIDIFWTAKTYKNKPPFLLAILSGYKYGRMANIHPIVNILRWPMKIIPISFLDWSINKIMRKEDSKGGDKTFKAFPHNRRIWGYADTSKTGLINFEGVKLSAYEEPEKYLETFYGTTWNVIPDKKKTHHITLKKPLSE